MEGAVFDRHGGRKYLNESERQAYLRVVKKEPDKARRAFCLLLLFTGCRISEALNVVKERIDVSQKCVVFETLKQRRRGVFRAVPIPESLTLLLGDIATSNPTTKVWPYSRATAYRMIKDFIMQAGIQGVLACPKGLRHGFAIACIAKNIPLTTIQKWLGHARLETTAIYLLAMGEEERNLASRVWLNQ